MIQLLRLFWVFCKIGAVTFGGGYGMITPIGQEVVSRGWCSQEMFVNIVAISQMTPGPVGLNAATYVGKLTAGVPGALVASLGLVFPALCITTVLGFFLGSPSKLKVLKGAVRGIRAAALGLIMTAVIFFAENSIFSSELPLNRRVVEAAGSFREALPDLNFFALGIFAFILFLRKKYRLSSVYCILISLAAGLVLFGFL